MYRWAGIQAAGKYNMHYKITYLDYYVASSNGCQ